METRLEKNKRLNKLIRIKRLKRICIFLVFILLILGIEIVNQKIIELDCLDNPNIIRIDIKTKEIDFFGKSYIIDLDIIRNLLKDQFSGLLVLHNCNYLL